MLKYLPMIAFCLTVPAANWLIQNLGWQFEPQGPHLIPVAPGLMAPSGVLMVGVALLLRDLVQHRLGIRWCFIAIVIGGCLSAVFSPRSLVVASVSAFILSEVADLFVYTPLYRRRLLLAVMLSGIVGAAVDSAIFLWIAFSSLDLLTGQVIGKLWMTFGCVPVLLLTRHVRRAA